MSLTPWTWNAVVDGEHNVMVMMKTSACKMCRFLSVIYVAAGMGNEG